MEKLFKNLDHLLYMYCRRPYSALAMSLSNNADRPAKFSLLEGLNTWRKDLEPPVFIYRDARNQHLCGLEDDNLFLITLPAVQYKCHNLKPYPTYLMVYVPSSFFFLYNMFNPVNEVVCVYISVYIHNIYIYIYKL